MANSYICETCGEIVLLGDTHKGCTKAGILIAGRAGVGKSTLAKYIKQALQCNSVSSVIMPNATEVKRIAKECFGWDGKKDEKGRRLLQVIGTEAGRAYNPTIWVDNVIDRFLESSYDIVIVDDVRFPNEISRMREKLNPLMTIKVIGPQRVELGKSTQYHISETSLEEFENYTDFVYNTKDVEHLWGIAQKLVKGFLEWV